MSRYTGPRCRICRRHGMKLFLKGPRCFTDKCAFERRPSPPGIHKGARKRLSSYGLQLREKQKVRYIYGITERQFKKYFDMAAKMPGLTGENLLSLLERRLDNVVFRMGLSDSRAEARQMVLHGHILVNGKRVNIPSYLVEAGDVVELSERGKDHAKIRELLGEKEDLQVPEWLSFDRSAVKATVLREPRREDIDFQVQEQLIVEFYSK
ncbi:MAG: 30S ribosomal protein S4 [Candidatus Caldatribacterium sp.]|uniref:30S ribosomal protein S4 n=1 Tax=Candidatus Caldatribacterium sp. TaxID=2282143 RepID=UPI0029977EE5|nr:30S ribosomal protein S4 [Candidatus Caldatribacterium sp.]MCX7729928.1 30S ribosomal protein S4 [Candidatus Caldatribacterium sp.]MDW8082067.1 30S ribosomal protein S4 [Candidatus Calescibacterium sp.]